MEMTESKKIVIANPSLFVILSGALHRMVYRAERRISYALAQAKLREAIS